RASWEAGHAGEWWNGGGGPAGLRGAVTPLSARIVAMADTWSALTARGGPQLSHAEALVELDNAGGTRFDPRVVRAAHAGVAEERRVAARLGQRPGGGGQDRGPRGHRLQDGQAEALVERGQHERLRAGVEAGEEHVVDVAEHPQPSQSAFGAELRAVAAR